MATNNQKLVLCILGPTASGKSGLAEWIASQTSAELVNVDSAQIYKHLNIGSAKPDAETLNRIPHHLIDIREPFDTYSASEFVSDAEDAIADIHSRNKLPILVGGTMLYFKALFEGLAEMPEADEMVRRELEREIEEKGLAALHAELTEIDPKAAAKIRPTDPQRIQRALEVYRVSGKPISYWHEQQKLKQNEREDKFNFIKIALMPEDRAKLHERIELRLRQMMEQGFLKEVQELSLMPDFTRDCSAMRSVGYRQILAHVLDGEDLEESFMKAVFATRQLAKRQFTWLRKLRQTHAQIQVLDPFSKSYKTAYKEFLQLQNLL